jgi:hypothetical protein
MKITGLMDNFINDRTEINYNKLRDQVFDYLISVINSSQFKINSPRILIIDCDFLHILDTDKQTDNTLYNYFQATLYNNIPNHCLIPSGIRTAFYGYDSGIKESIVIPKNIDYFIKAYGSNLSQPTYYIVTSCLHDENII